MTPEHKAAIVNGRVESLAVKNYLDALEANKPKRGRKRTQDSVNKRLAAIAEELTSIRGEQRLLLVQEQMDLETELEVMNSAPDISSIEDAFVAVAKSYAERKGVSYAAWRAVGVSAEVLAKAKIHR